MKEEKQERDSRMKAVQDHLDEARDILQNRGAFDLKEEIEIAKMLQSEKLTGYLIHWIGESEERLCEVHNALHIIGKHLEGM